MLCNQTVLTVSLLSQHTLGEKDISQVLLLQTALQTSMLVRGTVTGGEMEGSMRGDGGEMRGDGGLSLVFCQVLV